MKILSTFALTEKEADEDFDKLKRSPKLLDHESYACLSRTTQLKTQLALTTNILKV